MSPSPWRRRRGNSFNFTLSYPPTSLATSALSPYRTPAKMGLTTAVRARTSSATGFLCFSLRTSMTVLPEGRLVPIMLWLQSCPLRAALFKVANYRRTSGGAGPRRIARRTLLPPSGRRWRAAPDEGRAGNLQSRNPAPPSSAIATMSFRKSESALSFELAPIRPSKVRQRRIDRTQAGRLDDR